MKGTGKQEEMIMPRLNSDLSKFVLPKKVSLSGRQSMNGAQVTQGGLRRNFRNMKLRTVFLGATVVVMLANQAACLQLSVDPANGSVRILRGRRPPITTPEPGVVREFKDCGGNLTAFTQPARIYSPGYPSTYDSEQECRWVITAVQGNVTLRFLHVQIEESPDCEFDSVDVLIGPSQESAGRLCGAMTNYTIATNTSSVTVVFRSDDNYEEKGFSLEFYAEIDAAGLAEECGDTLVGDEGNVTSPGYPLPYPHKSSCWTLINVDPGRVISMRFKDLTLETDELCTFDYVEIFDGSSEDAPSFGRLCMESQQRTLRSTTSSVLVHFKSDDLTNSRGFLLEYKSDSAGIKVSHEGGCAVTSGFDNGTVASPGYPNKYPASAHCLIDLEAPREAKVALQFVEFSLEPDVECNFDFVEIWDGQQEGWRFLGRLCGDTGENAELMSSENRIRLKFHSDNSTESRGFVANFKLIFPQDRPEAEKGNNTIMRNRTLVPALKLMHEIPGDIAVAEDDEEFLNCIPKAPRSSVAWSKDGMILNGNEPLPDLYLVPPGTLWIRQMHSNLAGSYTCRVITNYLEAESASVVVMQGTKTSDDCGIQFRKSPKDQELPQGETMVMQCAAQVSLLQPTSVVTIAWLHNGQPFPTSSRYRDQGNGLAYVNDATPKDTAVYTCVATDRHSRCSVKRSALYKVLPRISVEEICGNPVVSRTNTTRPPAQQGKIVGGEDTVKGAYPWQVMFWSPSLERAFCGGTLLNDRWVLSAAHCFQHELVQPEEVQVRLGEHDRLEAEPEEVTTKIADIYFHPKFDASTYDNDIALLLLADRVKFTDYIQPACLGDRVAIERDEFNSTDGVRKGKVTGWGQLAEDVHTLPRYLQEIELPIVNQDVCRNTTTYKVTDNMFCAGYAQEIVGDACQGDSGGPFVVQRKSRWYIVGIVSWGVGCGRRGNYGYYTKVTNYHDWIKEKIMY